MLPLSDCKKIVSGIIKALQPWSLSTSLLVAGEVCDLGIKAYSPDALMITWSLCEYWIKAMKAEYKNLAFIITFSLNFQNKCHIWTLNHDVHFVKRIKKNTLKSSRRKNMIIALRYLEVMCEAASRRHYSRCWMARCTMTVAGICRSLVAS